MNPNALKKPATLGDLQELEGRLFHLFRSNHLALVTHLCESETRIMSAISDYAARVLTYTETVVSGLTRINTAVAKIDALVTKLQGTQGQITPEDQALLDQIEAGVKGLADMTDATVTSTEDGVPADNAPPVEP